MYTHVIVGSNDLDRSRRFYDALFGALGGRPGVRDDKGRILYRHAGAVFIVTRPIDGQPACHANGGTIGFRADGVAEVEACHAAGLAHGGTAIESPPGERLTGMGAAYLGYLRDPDGNKLCIGCPVAARAA